MKKLNLHATNVTMSHALWAPIEDVDENIKRLEFLDSCGIDAKVGDVAVDIFVEKIRSNNPHLSDEEYNVALSTAIQSSNVLRATIVWLVGVTFMQYDIDAFQRQKQSPNAKADDGDKCAHCEKHGNCFVEDMIKSLGN